MRTKEEINDLIAELKTNLDNYPYEEHEIKAIEDKIELLNWVLRG